MSGRLRSLLIVVGCSLGIVLSTSQLVNASIHAVGYKVEENGDVIFMIGDNGTIQPNSGDILIDGDAYRLNQTAAAPADDFFDGSIRTTVAFSNLTWVKATIAAGTLANGMHTVELGPQYAPANPLTGFLPWTITLNTAPADSDGDGVPDDEDAFPNDPSESADSDGDGVGDNADAFPNDDTETVDTDGDGVGDNADEFPNDPTEQTDNDGDGDGDNADTDDDNDGLRDELELAIGTDPNLADTDNDGLDDMEDPDPLDNGILPLEAVATFIRDATLHPDVILDEDLLDPNLRQVLQNRLTMIILVIRTVEEINNPFAEFFLTFAAIIEIERDLQRRTDGFTGGNPDNDWVINEDAQMLLYDDLSFLSDLLRLTL